MSINVLPPDVTRSPRLADGPGPAALRATTRAAAVAEELHDSGHELRFGAAEDGRVQVELRAPTGEVTRLSPSEILALAAGAPVPGAPVVGEARWPWL